MVTQITLGNFSTINGRTVLFGSGGSGLNTQALIETLAGAKALAANQYKDKLSVNSKQSTALVEFYNLLNAVKDSANFLRNPPGVGNAVDNAFKYVTASVTASDSSSGYVSVNVSPGTDVASYTIDDIESVATATKQKTETITVTDANTSVVSDTPGADEFKAGTFTLNGESITFNVGDSLNVIAARINAVSGDTGIRASVFQVADGEYQLNFTATQTGTENDFDFNNVDPAGTLVDASGVFTNITITDIQDATDAVFTVNGVEITRSTNAVDDVIEGVTFNLTQATPDGVTLEVNIEQDAQVVRNGIVNFINAYNELKIFAAKQNELNEDGTFKDTAVLNNNSTLRTTLSSLHLQLSTITSRLMVGDPPAPALTFTDLPESEDNPLVRNLINVDEDALNSIIESDPEEVRTAFEFDFVSDNPAVSIFSRTNSFGLSGEPFTLTVNPFAEQETQTISVATADDPIAFTVPAAGQFKAGTITIRGQVITISDGDSLNEIAAAFNAVEGTTGLHADVVDLGGGSFKMVFTATASGSSVNYDLSDDDVDPNGIFSELTLTVTEEIYQAVYDIGGGPVTVDLTATETASGFTLEGPEGTLFEGIKLIYGGKNTSTAEITMTQGIADLVYNLSDGVTDTEEGAIKVELDALAASDTKLNEEITKINEQVAQFREQLLVKFAALEAAISRVNTLLQALDAQEQARQNAS